MTKWILKSSKLRKAHLRSNSTFRSRERKVMNAAKEMSTEIDERNKLVVVAENKNSVRTGGEKEENGESGT